MSIKERSHENKNARVALLLLSDAWVLLFHYFITLGSMVLFKEFYINLIRFLFIEAALINGLYGFVKKKTNFIPIALAYRGYYCTVLSSI